MAKGSKATITQRSNRQVNYAIIRLLWNEYRKKQNLYDFIGIPKNRYATIINGTYQMLMDSESKKLEEEWGVDASVFNGDVIVSVKGIDRATWDEYFTNRDEITIVADEEKEEISNRIASFTKSFHAVTQIEQFIGDSNADLNLWKLYRFIRFKEKNVGSIQQVKLDNAMDTLGDVSSVLFESVPDKLNSYIETLESALDKAKTVRDYHEMKKKESF